MRFFGRRTTSRWDDDRRQRSQRVRQANSEILVRASESLATAAGAGAGGIITSAAAFGAGAGTIVSSGAGIVAASVAKVGIDSAKDWWSERGRGPARSFQDVATQLQLIIYRLRAIGLGLTRLETSVQLTDARIAEVVDGGGADVDEALEALAERRFELEQGTLALLAAERDIQLYLTARGAAAG